ncbi:DHH family protein [Hortaea werneckii]|nr:DHH family protein [Hortaea werneckii]KAI7004749.1 DHH family protein [Hortaea werneckii]KAI7656467.1 DHH family protein [Hortaea werneckii]
MKRKASPTKVGSPPKKAKADIPEYHLSPLVREEDGSIQWPAPRAQIEKSRQMILDCAKSQSKTLIVPDKDADGLSAGAILRHTLMILGLPKNLIAVHLLTKGNTVHSEQQRQRMAEHRSEYVWSEHVSACHSPPVATSALLTYEICKPLHPDVYERCAWLAIVGTYGDLGNQIKWEAPFPDMREILKRHSKKKLSDVVSAVNAPRRTATYDVKSAWDALCDTSEPGSIPKNPRLEAARQEVAAEVERCTHTAPKFSPDGKVAVFRIRSEAQVHPVIATRWAGHLSSNKLEFVLVANEGYLPGKVNFSCRIARSARNRDPPISIIDRLRYYASLNEAQNDSADNADSGEAKRVPLLERVGDDFARGHVQASGGIVNAEEFEELMRLMQIGVKPPKDKSISGSPSKKKAKAGIDPGQNNTLTSYFGKASTPKA